MDNSKEYISILIESLKKKKHILRDIRVANEEQKNIAMNEPFDDEAFERNIEEKEALIKALTSLDRGFDSVYSRVSETLKNNKEAYKEEIIELKELVSEVDRNAFVIVSDVREVLGEGFLEHENQA